MGRASRGRRAYDRVAGTDEPAENDLESPPSRQVNDTSAVEEDSLASDSKEDGNEADEEEDGERITVVVMDPAQNKFEISVNPNWTVARLKRQGVTIHKISTFQQRLIFMGRLLSDDMILKDAKINRDGVIIHLFPKPRVVVQGSNPEPRTDETTSAGNSQGGGGGAHVPQIVLDPDEAQMRSQILVLGSAEIMDAQNNVKLLSFLLLIITSMELLALFTIILGVPESVADETGMDDTVQTDDAMHHHSGQPEVRTWRHSDYFDLLLNLFGFYAAVLGIKATTENTRRLAFQYLVCTVVCGVFWNAFYYYLNFQVEKEIDVEQHKNNDAKEPMLTTQQYLVQAFFAILIPMMIWCMCCLRAYQFHHLLEEAEREAEGRIQNEIRMVEEGNLANEDDAAEGVLT
jgi:hypothetical protein